MSDDAPDPDDAPKIKFEPEWITYSGGASIPFSQAVLLAVIIFIVLVSR